MKNTATMTEAPASERNPTVEAWIEGFGVTEWDFRIVLLSDIDIKTSHANQARFKPIDQMTVNRYGLAAAAGAKFPPLVLAKVGTSLVVVDGNHRVGGLPLGGVHEHPAYIVDEPEAKRRIMTATANTMNGLPFTEDEVRRLAVDLSRDGSLTADQVAVLTGLSPAQVGTVARAADARDRASDRRAALRIADSDMEVIGRVASDPALDVLVASQAGAKRLTHKALREAVAAANRERSDAARVRVCEDRIAAAVGEKAKVARQVKDADKLNKAIGSILNCNPTAVAMGAKDRQALINRIEEAADHLATLAGALS